MYCLKICIIAWWFICINIACTKNPKEDSFLFLGENDSVEIDAFDVAKPFITVFSVLFNGEPRSFVSTQNSALKSLLQCFELYPDTFVSVNDTLHCLVLKSLNEVQKPVLLAKKISLLDRVLMVAVNTPN